MNRELGLALSKWFENAFLYEKCVQNSYFANVCGTEDWGGRRLDRIQGHFNIVAPVVVSRNWTEG